MDKYKSLNKTVRKMCRSAKGEYVDQQCVEIETWRRGMFK